MKSVIIYPKHELLKKYVQYFLFFKKEDSSSFHYTTFPNTNLCLAIYRGNQIDYSNTGAANNCRITPSARKFSSRLYGFHKMPFQVNVLGPLNQICIIFYPSALKVFTHESFTDLMQTEAAFDALFPRHSDFFLEQIFEEGNFNTKAQKLEHLLLNNIKNTIPDRIRVALHRISTDDTERLTIEQLCAELGLSDSTLFRLFKTHLGQNPKSYLKTKRFRNALQEMLSPDTSLSTVAHNAYYYDQAHFINDFKTLSGYTPKELQAKLSVQQNQLVWIYDKCMRE